MSFADELARRIEGRDDDTRVMLTVGQVRELLAALGQGRPTTPGAVIYDHDRNVTYRATADTERGDLDHLEVIVHGHVDDNAMKRVPVARIRAEVLAQLAADRAAGGPTFVPSGGLTTGDGSRYSPPPLDEVAELMSKGLDRHALQARYPGRPLRTIDGWIRRARQQYPDLVPARTSGRRRSQTPGGEGRRTTREKGNQQ